jgi:hypothetical protein
MRRQAHVGPKQCDSCRRVRDVTGVMLNARDEDRARLDAIFKILVDFCFRNVVVVTLVSRLPQIDHHFFLDFTFY